MVSISVVLLLELIKVFVSAFPIFKLLYRGFAVSWLSVSRGGTSSRMRCTFLKVVVAPCSHVLQERWPKASVSCKSVLRSHGLVLVQRQACTWVS